MLPSTLRGVWSVPNLNEVATVLSPLGDSTEAAYGAAYRLRHSIQEVGERASGLGFDGIASRLQQAEDTAADLCQSAGLARDRATEAIKPIVEAPSEVAVSDAIARLTPMVQAVEEIKAQLATVQSRLDEIKGIVSAALDGADPGPILGMADQVDGHVMDAFSRLDPGTEAVQAAIGHLSSLGALGSRGN